MYSNNTLKRFWNKVEVGSPDECWLWQAYKFVGYGKFGVGQVVHLAHRISYIIANGEIPDGKCVLHRCNNPSCVNPNHLYIGTQKDNHTDSVMAGTASPPPLHFGEKHPQAKVTEKDIISIRESYGPRNPSRKLAQKYGVDKATILRIVNRHTWKHI